MRTFKVGDEVVDIISGERGTLTEEVGDIYPLRLVNESYKYDGRVYYTDKYPSLYLKSEIVNGCISVRVEPEKIVKWVVLFRHQLSREDDFVSFDSEEEANNYQVDTEWERIGPPQKLEFEIPEG